MYRGKRTLLQFCTLNVDKIVRKHKAKSKDP